MMRPRTLKFYRRIGFLVGRGQEPKRVAIRFKITVWTVYKAVEVMEERRHKRIAVARERRRNKAA